MPTIPLFAFALGTDLAATDPVTGAPLDVPRDQFRCLLTVRGAPPAYEAIVDTGAPLTIVPQEVWSRLRAGIDYQLLPLPAAVPRARVAGWQFAFHLARFLVPLVLHDTNLSVAVPRANVIAQFAIGARPNARGTPPVLIGLWGGLLEGAHIGIDRDPHTGRARGELLVP